MLRLSFYLSILLIAGWASYYLYERTMGSSKPTTHNLATKQTQPKIANKQNVILFTVDTLRTDHLSVYGYKRNTTPNLSKFSKDAIQFSQAFTTSTYSAPAHASLLTGLHPRQLGNMTNSIFIDEQVESIAEILKHQGYATAAFVGDSVLGQDANLHQGFDTFSVDHIHADTQMNITEKWAKRGWTKAKTWLKTVLTSSDSSEKSQQPFFLWFHANHPHGNYNPPKAYQKLFIKQAPEDIARHSQNDLFSLDSYFRQQIAQNQLDPKVKDWVIAQYDGEIFFVDKLFGELVEELKKLGVYDSTHIIFVADHGEVLFEHWRAGRVRSAGHHANLYYYDVLSVPLLIKPASSLTIVQRGKSVQPLVSSLDVFNTMLNLVGLEENKLSWSRSLVPFMTKPTEASFVTKERKGVFFVGESYNNQCDGIMTKQWQFVRCVSENEKKLNLFQRQYDQNEITHQVVKRSIEKEPMVIELEKMLDQWQIEIQQPITRNETKSATRQLSNKLREHLIKSGYLDKRENL